MKENAASVTEPDEILKRLDRHAQPLLEAENKLYQEVRQAYLKRIPWYAAGVALLTGLFIALCHEELQDSVWLIGGIGALVLLGSACLVSWLSGLSQLARSYKENAVPELCRICDPSLQFDPDQCIRQNDYHRSGLFSTKCDRYRGEDLVFGSFNGVDVAFSELHTEYKSTHTNKDGHTTTTWHTVFHGVFFTADFHKDFKHKTFVLPDVAEAMLGSLIGNFLQKCNLVQEGKLIRMENTVFEKKFAVYAEDEMEARYLLSPALMDEIVHLAERFKSRIRLSFIDSSICIAIPTSRNLFERKSSGPLKKEDLQHTLTELNDLLQIINELRLNVRIWSKK